LRLAHFFQPSGCNVRVFLRQSATLRCWFSKLGGDEALVLQPFQDGVDAANGYVSSRTLLQFLTDRDTIGIVAKADEDEDHHQFKAT